MTFKELIRKHGYNLTSLADKLGVDRATTHYWVKKKSIPRRETLEKTASILGESVEAIIAAIIHS